MKAPHYGWLTGLTNFMNEKFPKQWAYTGSFAMYCHAAAREIACREPRDIDILTSQVSPVWGELTEVLDGYLSNPPFAHASRARVEDARLHINGITPVRVNIDLLSDEAHYGDLKTVVKYHQGTTKLRVVPVATLIAAKAAIIKDEGFKAEHERARQDLEFLQKLL